MWSREKWYREQLNALEEPSFEEFKNSEEREAYRFVWLRTFHNPVAVRVVVQEDGGGTVYLKACSGRGGYEPGRLGIERTIKLSKEQVNGLREMVESNKFWEQSGYERFGLDGATWIVEVKRGGQYQYAEEWTPIEGSVRNIALFLIKLSGYRTKEVY